MAEKVVVGLSGGVDSAAAALLLKRQGYDVIGVTMQIWQPEAESGESCCGITAVEDARLVADTLGIPYHVLNFYSEFRAGVMDYFVEEYLRGRTPNPCVVCNRRIKWEALMARARELGAGYIATGHYARILKLDNGRYTVLNSVHIAKDQTYALYNLTQQQLAHTLMPVGLYSKDEVRAMAAEAGVPVAQKKDSQDICFVPDGDYAAFIQANAGSRMPGPGNFVSPQGKILGRHRGLIHYTVGQRKGLDLPMGHPVYVTALRPDTNEVMVGENSEVFSDTLVCGSVNFMGMEGLPEPREALVKIRYGHRGTMARLESVGPDRVRCTFQEPVRAVTPGQAAVFYEDGCVLGGGVIE